MCIFSSKEAELYDMRLVNTSKFPRGLKKLVKMSLEILMIEKTMTADVFVSKELHWNKENKYEKQEYFLSYKCVSNLFVYLGYQV